MSELIVLSAAEVERLLADAALVDALAGAMAELSAGRAAQPPRAVVDVAGEGLLLAMPAHLPRARALTTKLVTLFPANADRGLPTHHAAVLAFDPATGVPAALLDGRVLTAARTAAGSALSVRLLARADARVLAVLGTGVQARAHALAVAGERPFAEVRIAGRDAGKAAALASEVGAVLAVPVRGAASYAEAVAGADVVCAATHAPEPVVRREWLAPGAHVTSVGHNRAGAELDAATLRDADLVAVESRAAALDEASGSPALAAAIALGAVDGDRLVEIGELVTRRRAGRTGRDGITAYLSVGVAVQDAAAAALVLARAREAGAGARIEL